MGIDKANVPRGKKMPGHMGNEFRVGFNHKIVRINTKYNVVYIRVCGSTRSPAFVGAVVVVVVVVVVATYSRKMGRVVMEAQPRSTGKPTRSPMRPHITTKGIP